MDDLEICRMSATAMRKAIGAKKLSPVEIMMLFWRGLNGLIQKSMPTVPLLKTPGTKLKSRKKGDGWWTTRSLHGIPVSIKDLIFTKGIKTTAGWRCMKTLCLKGCNRGGEVEKCRSHYHRKTNTPEFGWIATTINQLFGATRNPGIWTNIRRFERRCGIGCCRLPGTFSYR